MKKLLLSVVEDDRFFRDSMGRLMRSLGYIVEAFPSAPAMTGIHLIDAGRAMPTILVTAYPNDVDRARPLNDGVVRYLRKPVDQQHLIRRLRAALTSGEPTEEDS